MIVDRPVRPAPFEGAVASAPGRDRPSRIGASVGDTVLQGIAIDLRPWSIGADTATRAIHGDTHECTVLCSRPGSLFDTVGTVDRSLDLSLPTLLAAVARRRGHRADSGAELRSVRAELAMLSPACCDRADLRKAVARAGTDEAELAERVAAIRGELQARRDADEDVSSVEERLSEAVAALTSARTERLSAEQALDQAREADTRDRRDRRLRLQDRERNLERAVHRELADAVYEAFAAAVRSVPGTAQPGTSVSDYEGDDVTAALAVLRMLRTATPAVIAVDRFESPEHAARKLGVPVVRV